MTPEQLLSFKLPLFEGVTPADLAGIPLDAHEQSLRAAQTLFDQEDRSYDLYFLLSGSLLAVFWTTQGREIVFSRFPVGAYFGELSAMGGVPRSLAVVAKSRSKLLTLKRQCFLRIYNDVPKVRDRINSGLITQVRTLTQKNMEMTTLSVAERTVRYLYRLAQAEGALDAGAVIEGAPTHAEIAGTIGANREMVSRTISKLSKQGVINSSRQKITVLDPQALADAADEPLNQS